MSSDRQLPFEPDARRFKDNMRRRRFQLGLDQKALAKAAGVGVQTVWRIENGKTHHIQPKTAKAIADALQMDPLDLYGEPAVPRVVVPEADYLSDGDSETGVADEASTNLKVS